MTTDIHPASLLRQVETDGICLILSGKATERRAIVDAVHATRQPIVLIQEELADGIVDGAALYMDDRRGAMLLGQHLFAQPAKHVAMLVPVIEWPAIERRQIGIQQVIEKLSAKPEFHLVHAVDES